MDDDDLGGGEATAPASRDLVAGLDNGLQVIEAFDQERARLTMTEVANGASYFQPCNDETNELLGHRVR